MATWSVLCKSLLKNAVEGGKAAAPHIMTFSKMAFPYVKSGVKFAVEHPKSAAAMTAVALPIVGYKKGLLTFAKEKKAPTRDLLIQPPPFFSEVIKMLMVMKNP